MALEISIIPVTPFQQNCTLLRCTNTGDKAVIDAGGDIELIKAEINKTEGELKNVFLTHGHLDHAGASRQLADDYKVSLVGPQREDLFWLESIPEQAKSFGFPSFDAFEPDQWLEQGDTIVVGDSTLSVLHCPGHTPGHVVFYDKEQGFLIVGDVIFAGSVGRTDFPRSDSKALLSSIKENLFCLPEESVIYPGHGETTTIGREKKTNPFVGEQATGNWM